MFPDRKGVYHSELVSACDLLGGKLHVRFLGAPRDSKYSGKLPYVGFDVEGDPKERLYQIEHAGIRSYISALPMNVPLWIQAAGSGDAATVMAWDDTGRPLGVSQPAPAAPPPQAPPPGQNRWGGTSSAPAPQQPQPSPNGWGQPAPAQPPAPAPQPAQSPAPTSFVDRPAHLPMADAFWAGLCLAERVIAQFEIKFHRPPREEELKVAMHFAIEHGYRPERAWLPESELGLPRRPPEGTKAAPAPPAPPPEQPAPVPASEPAAPWKDEDDDLPF